MIREIRYPSVGQSIALVERRISWGAVIAGAAFTLAAMVTLSLLGAGVGLLAAPGAGVGAAAGGWLFLTAVLAYFGGGWIAGRLTGIPSVSESVIHGVIMWAFTTVATLLLLTTALGKELSSVGQLFGGTIGGAAEAGRAAGLFAFAAMIFEAFAAAFGARLGTRVLRPLSDGVGEARREPHSLVR